MFVKIMELCWLFPEATNGASRSALTISETSKGSNKSCAFKRICQKVRNSVQFRLSHMPVKLSSTIASSFIRQHSTSRAFLDGHLQSFIWIRNVGGIQILSPTTHILPPVRCED